jgi:hypothetical protein
VSIATLKDELLREIAAEALADRIGVGFARRGAGTDLIHWVTGPPNLLQQAFVFMDRGPALIVKHVTAGMKVWLAPGTHGTYLGGTHEIVVTETVYRTNDPEGVTRIHAKCDMGLSVLFAENEHVASFLENVLAGHVQDA